MGIKEILAAEVPYVFSAEVAGEESSATAVGFKEVSVAATIEFMKDFSAVGVSSKENSDVGVEKIPGITPEKVPVTEGFILAFGTEDKTFVVSTVEKFPVVECCAVADEVKEVSIAATTMERIFVAVEDEEAPTASIQKDFVASVEGFSAVTSGAANFLTTEVKKIPADATEYGFAAGDEKKSIAVAEMEGFAVTVTIEGGFADVDGDYKKSVAGIDVDYTNGAKEVCVRVQADLSVAEDERFSGKGFATYEEGFAAGDDKLPTLDIDKEAVAAEVDETTKEVPVVLFVGVDETSFSKTKKVLAIGVGDSSTSVVVVEEGSVVRIEGFFEIHAADVKEISTAGSGTRDYRVATATAVGVIEGLEGVDVVLLSVLDV
ncbi:hypothetical protein R1sor_001598 [Riccia sorocarpa]|uniref:Uncharacterized protein n=1 Tax=Riccia sorocarpa TaxID=122646 RepID=A0ABD3H0K1_9MARC